MTDSASENTLFQEITTKIFAAKKLPEDWVEVWNLWDLFKNLADTGNIDAAAWFAGVVVSRAHADEVDCFIENSLNCLKENKRPDKALELAQIYIEVSRKAEKEENATSIVCGLHGPEIEERKIIELADKAFSLEPLHPQKLSVACGLIKGMGIAEIQPQLIADFANRCLQTATEVKLLKRTDALISAMVFGDVPEFTIVQVALEALKAEPTTETAVEILRFLSKKTNIYDDRMSAYAQGCLDILPNEAHFELAGKFCAFFKERLKKTSVDNKNHYNTAAAEFFKKCHDKAPSPAQKDLIISQAIIYTESLANNLPAKCENELSNFAEWCHKNTQTGKASYERWESFKKKLGKKQILMPAERLTQNLREIARQLGIEVEMAGK